MNFYRGHILLELILSVCLLGLILSFLLESMASTTLTLNKLAKEKRGIHLLHHIQSELNKKSFHDIYHCIKKGQYAPIDPTQVSPFFIQLQAPDLLTYFKNPGGSPRYPLGLPPIEDFKEAYLPIEVSLYDRNPQNARTPFLKCTLIKNRPLHGNHLPTTIRNGKNRAK